MAYTYDLSTNVGKVRNLINDTTESTALLSDEEISSILTLRSSDIYMSAALCLRKMAANKVLLAKMKAAGDYKEDLRAIYKGLIELAKIYEDMSITDPAEADQEVILTDHNYNQILQDRSLRGVSLDD